MSPISEKPHNTKNFQVLPYESRRTVNYGLEINVIDHLFFAQITDKIYISNYLNSFKRKMKNRKGENCPCCVKCTLDN